MAELLARTPCEGLGLPIVQGTVELAEWVAGPITSIAPARGQEAAVTAALAPLGLAFPAPNGMLVAGAARIVWTGRNQAFLIGAPCPAIPGAALTDQSDGWAGLRLSGPHARDVLTRLVPLDLRDSALAPGSAARSLLNHMPLVLMRPEAGVWDILTFRSMARTAVHEIGAAMTALEGRARL